MIISQIGYKYGRKFTQALSKAINAHSVCTRDFNVLEEEEEKSYGSAYSVRFISTSHIGSVGKSSCS